MENTAADCDQRYLQILLKRIEICRQYRPRFGQGQAAGLSLEQFQQLYRSDTFYEWFGLDNPLMYAAHKAAGGITSVYRQIGIGCEQVFRQIIQDHLGLEPDQAKWSYTTEYQGKIRKPALDGRIALADIANPQQRIRMQRWLHEACTVVGVANEIAGVLKGAVFEVRQGYKSKDSKRQNADIANAATAYAQGYLPVVAMLSSQIDNDIAMRYQHEKWLILRGMLHSAPWQSTYAFCHDILGYDLAQFFQTHSPIIKANIEDVLKVLLTADE
ncbi:MAG: hypothetical protein ACUVRU_09660 [Anaerolineae bacterium]